MNLENLKDFFRKRPSLNQSSIAEEIGISRQYLTMILNDDRRLTEATKKKMKPILLKYGWKPG